MRVALVALVWLVAAAPASGAVVRASVSPAQVAFGDRFTYVVEARPADARIVADTGSFATLAPARTERGGESVRLTQTLACLQLACLRERVELPPARVGTSVAAPVVVGVTRRVPAAAVAAPRAAYRVERDLPPATTRVSPGVLTALLAGAAALLALAALALVFPRRRRSAAGALDPLARALRLLRESARRPSPDRRRAADLLARVARDGALAHDATRLAWSEREPEPEDATALAGRAEAPG